MSNDPTFQASAITFGPKGEILFPGCYIGGHSGQYALGEMVALADDLLGTDFAKDYPRDEEGNLAGAIGPGGVWDIGNDHTEACVAVGDSAEAALNKATEGGYWTWEDGEFFLVSNDELDSDDEAW